MNDLFTNEDFGNPPKENIPGVRESSAADPITPGIDSEKIEPMIEPEIKLSAVTTERDTRTYKLKQVQLAKTATKIENSSFGPLLKRLREEHDLTLFDLSERTKISINYLTALEEENYSLLPQPVYVAAYIRKLGFIYSLDEDEISRLTAEVKALIYPETPQGDDIENVVVNFEHSEENVRKVRQIIWGTLIVFVLVTLSVILGLNMLFSKSSGTPATSVNNRSVGSTNFDPAKLLKIQEKPTLNSAQMDVPH